MKFVLRKFILFYIDSLKMRKSKYRFEIIILFLLSCVILIINFKDILYQRMDITVDFTGQHHPKLSQLQQHPYLRSVTFILPFFKQRKQNFLELWDYITFLNDKPLVKIFVKPKGQQIKPKYNVVAVGGTFDHLHIGHQMLLLYSVLSAKNKVIIGVTSKQMLQKKANKEIIQSVLMRINQVRQFIKTFRPEVQLQFVELEDPFGPTVTNQNIDAIAVTPETLKMAETINEKRKEKGFHPLIVQNCPIMAPVHHLTSIKAIENKISSTQIRAHILAKNGLTIQKYIQYKEIWMNMVNKINAILGVDEQANHLISRKWWDIVVKYYSQYWRYYHTNHHIATMFKQLNETPEMGYDKLSQIDKIVLEISIFFHDIIYRPDLQLNELDSAHFAQHFIKEIWIGQGHENEKKQIIDKVKSAILKTQNHHSTTEVEKILNELDMSILDAPLQKYKTFAFNIEREYRPLVKDLYGKKRTLFLQKVLGTVKYCWRKGQNYQQNIKWEISHWKNQKSE